MLLHQRICLIFCLVNELEMTEFSDMADWACQHPNEKTVLILTEEEVYKYQHLGLWEIISSETDNWLFGPHEEDWIFDFDIMKAIVLALQNSSLKNDHIVSKMIYILQYAIYYNKSVIFCL